MADDIDRTPIPIVFYALLPNDLTIAVEANIVPGSDASDHVFVDRRLRYIILAVDKLPFITYFVIRPVDVDGDGA